MSSGTYVNFGFQDRAPIDASDPLFLHPSDHPGMLLVTKQMDGTNFGTWKKSMSIALSAKNKLSFVCGLIPKPTDGDISINSWQRCNDMITSWVLNSLAPDIAESVLFTDSVSKIWSELEDRYGQASGARLYQLHKDTVSIEQGVCDIAGYYAKFKKLNDEFMSMKSFPPCTCGHVQALAKFDEDQKLVQFLMGLNDSYNAVRGNILMMKPLPNVNQAYSILIQEEKQREVKSGAKLDNDSMAFVGKTFQRNTNNQSTISGGPEFHKNRFDSRRSPLYCTHCKRPGHVLSKCYRLIGYPRDNRFTRGHRVAAVTTSNTEENQTDIAPSTDQNKKFLTTTEYEQLMQLFSKLNTKDQGNPDYGSYAQFAGNSNLNFNLLHPSFDKTSTWILDSGASDHMSHERSLFEKLHELQKPFHITMPNGNHVRVSMFGRVRLTPQLYLENVLYVPQFKYNLLSIGQLCHNLQATVIFTETKCLIQAPLLKNPLVLGNLRNGLYLTDCKEIGTKQVTREPADQAVFFGDTRCRESFISNVNFGNKDVFENVLLWHARLGHLPLYKLKSLQVIKNGIVKSDLCCSICHKARQHRKPFPKRERKATHPFHLIHLDLWGPYQIPTHGGYRYFLTIVDDHTRVTWTHLLKTKSSALEIIRGLVRMASTQFQAKIMKIRSDNALELGKSNQAMEFFSQEGIHHETSCVDTPQQNGVVERKHKHLLETSRALMFHSKLPIQFWGDCVLTATYLINRFPSKYLGWKSPYELLFHQPPSLQHLRVFGSLCYASTLKRNRDKMQPRASPCLMMGYPFGQKGYRLYNLETKLFFTSRDVEFYESILPGISHNPNSSVFPIPSFSDMLQDTMGRTEANPTDFSNPNSDESDVFPGSSPSLAQSPSNASHTEDTSPTSQIPELRRSTRLSKEPSYLKDYVRPQQGASHFTTCTESLCSHTLTQLCGPRKRYGLVSNTMSHSEKIREPQTYDEAVQNPSWVEAMNKEFDALHQNKTWDLVPLPKGKKAISCKWVYKAKYNSDGSLERYKARLVVRGFTQKEGIDFTDTFSPVVKLTTIRSLIAIAVQRGWKMHQMDVNNAFLHGDLHEEIYMKPPSGLPLPSPSHVCKLRKSLYGLKQASRQWYAKLCDKLKSNGYHGSKNDYSVFIKTMGAQIVIIAIYVDDILVTGNNEDEIDQLKRFLDAEFKIKDLGALHYFLGLEVITNPNGVILTQTKFVKEILEEFDDGSFQRASSPLDPSTKLRPDQGSPLSDPTMYRKLIGKLNFLTNTRPDMAFTVQHLSQFMQAPRDSHWTAAKHALAYLRRTASQGLYYSRSSTFTLQAHCDSDWAACPLTRRSITGYVVHLGDSLISWKSKKQPTVSLSSAEAEYRSLRNVTAELAWLSRLLAEFGVTSVQPIPVKSDSLSAIYIARNPVQHERTKHVEVDCHFVRDKLQEGFISLHHVPSSDQLADLLTKALSGGPHSAIMSKLAALRSPT